MTRQVVLATRNSRKLAEMRRLLGAAQVDLEILGLSDVVGYPEPYEDSTTFEGNALLKAHACVRATGLPALADDSGLEVDVLNNMPGVRSARWAGPGASDEDNLQLLLRQIADVPDGARTGRFACAMALVTPDGQEHVARRDIEGEIVESPMGHNGFGYDPIFVAAGQRSTNAQLEPSEKDAISHRGSAVRAILPILKSWAEEA